MKKNEAQILVTGDTHLGGGRVKNLALENSVDQLFGDFKDIINRSDLSITNLESPLIDDAKPIKKTGPNLKSPVNTVKILNNAGFDLLTLANNHIKDYGEVGLHNTLKTCQVNELATVGANKDKESAQESFTTSINGILIGIVNIAENEFGTTNNQDFGAHPLNPVNNFYTIGKLSKEVDHVIVIIHGGHENYSLPSPRMKATYRFFIDAGADSVIGHHPHCYSGYEIYKKSPIFYSLGNFLFDKDRPYDPKWNVGYMVQLFLSKKDLDYSLIPYVQNDEQVGLRSLESSELEKFNNEVKKLNEIIADDIELEKAFDKFCDSSRKLYSTYIEPHGFKYIHALRNRNLFPSLLSDRKKRLLLNLTRCEAHRDVLINILGE